MTNIEILTARLNAFEYRREIFNALQAIALKKAISEKHTEKSELPADTRTHRPQKTCKTF